MFKKFTSSIAHGQGHIIFPSLNLIVFVMNNRTTKYEELNFRETIEKYDIKYYLNWPNKQYELYSLSDPNVNIITKEELRKLLNIKKFNESFESHLK